MMERRSFLASLIAAAIPIKIPNRATGGIVYSNQKLVPAALVSKARIFYATKFVGISNVKNPDPPSFELSKIHIYENIMD